MGKVTRTLNVYDKGSNYLLLDDNDITPLYNVRWNTHTTPHMIITRSSDPDTVTGSATFFPAKKAGFFASASIIQLHVHEKEYEFKKEGGIFSLDKRAFHSRSNGTLHWKGGYAASGYLKLVDRKGRIIADYQNRMYSGKTMGIIEITNLVDVDDAFLDEIVVSGMAMLSEEKTSMGNVAAAMSSAGGA